MKPSSRFEDHPGGVCAKVSSWLSGAPSGWVLGVVVVALGLVPAVLAAPAARAERVALGQYVSAIYVGNQKNLTAGPELTRGGLVARVLGTVPFARDQTTGAGDVTLPTSWRIGGSIEYEHDVSAEDGRFDGFMRFGLAGSWGRRQLSYRPSLDSSAISMVRHSFAIVARGLYYRAQNRKNGLQMAPQLRVTYGRQWRAAESELIVVPSTDGGPDTVQRMVRNPPVVAPALEVSLAVPLYLGGNVPLAYAPALVLTMAGESGAWSPLGAGARLRGETWLYYFAAASARTNVRVGVAPYLSSRLAGSDGADRLDYGAMVELRVGTTLLEL